MPTLRPLALFAVLLLPSTAAAQFQFSENGNGTLRVHRSASGTGEALLQFGFARGSYRNGLELINASSASSCVFGPTETVNDCKFFSGDCIACGSDPNAYSGDISCFCKKIDPAWSFSESLALITTATPLDLDLSLVTDRFGAGVVDQKLFAQPSMNPNGGDQMRAYHLTPDLGRIDWEDIPQAPDGDFNDVMSYVMGRSCAESGGFPPSTGIGDVPFLCNDDCLPLDEECEEKGFIPRSDLRFTVHVSIDQINGEGDREPKGRMIHVTIATYGVDADAGRKIAVCPNLVLQNLPSSTADWQDVTYGRLRADIEPPTECEEAPSPDGIPICNKFPQSSPPPYLFFGLARDQHYVADSCTATRQGTGDTFELMNSASIVNSACDAMMPHIETYEVSTEALDTVIGIPPINLKTSIMSDLDLLDLISGVQLSIVTDVTAFPFHCPVGLNPVVRSVLPQLGKLQSVDILQGVTFNYWEGLRL